MIRSVLLWVFLIQTPHPAAEADYVCPQDIAVNWKVSARPEAWQVLNPESATTSRHALAGIAFTYGHPKGRGYLKPTRTEALDEDPGGRSREIHVFSGVAGDVWLVCEYQETPAIIFKPLAASYTVCEILYTKNDLSSHVIQCR